MSLSFGMRNESWVSVREMYGNMRKLLELYSQHVNRSMEGRPGLQKLIE